MKRLLFIIVVCVFVAVPAMASLSWTYDYADGDGTSLTCPIPGAIVDTFDGTRPGWTYIGNSHILTGDSGIASAPWSVLDGVKDNTPYLAVPNTITDANPLNYVTVEFDAGDLYYLGLHWGSMDDYNMIEFLSHLSIRSRRGEAGAQNSYNYLSCNLLIQRFSNENVTYYFQIFSKKVSA